MFLSCLIYAMFGFNIVREIWIYVGGKVKEMSGNFVLPYVWEPCFGISELILGFE